jgi:hypothetical protein
MIIVPTTNNDLKLFQIFASVVLLICDRESEEIFYKERPVEDEEGGEGGEEGEKEEN